MKSQSQVRVSDPLIESTCDDCLSLSNRNNKRKDMLVAGLATCAPGGNHVFKLLIDIGAILFKDHDTQGAVMGGNTRGPGHRGVKLLIDDVLHHGVDR